MLNPWLLTTGTILACVSWGSSQPPSPAQMESCGRPAITPSALSRNRILGGEASVAGSWPWQVRIGEKVKLGISFFCGGTILNPLYVITAGHCFPGSSSDPRKYVIRVAEYNMSASEDVERDYTVSYIYKHPYYASVGSPSNDITLVRLAYPITFTPRISGICLPPINSDPAPGRKCVVTGWGRFVDQFRVLPVTGNSTGNATSTTSAPTTSKKATVTTVKAKNSTVTGSSSTTTRPFTRTTHPSTKTQRGQSSTSVTSSSNVKQGSSAQPLLPHVGVEPLPLPVFFTDDEGKSGGGPMTTVRGTTSRSTITTTHSTTTGIPKPPTHQVIITSDKTGAVFQTLPKKPLRPWKGKPKLRPRMRALLERLQHRAAAGPPGQQSAAVIAAHAEVLQQSVLPILDRKNCTAYWKNLMRDSMICTFPAQQNSEPCKGDSGGPLVCQNVDGDDTYWTLDGIISFGAGCGGKKPAVYTRVSSFLRWVEKTAKWPNPNPLPGSSSFNPFFNFPGL
ncbi:putative Chymotrypsinogen A [Hypsibius exemplaris]|uniref:Chymotrypsinogen A n=1 Tax=Hypsibius exemplaris TaxID=2072580 RepID=A0A1W0WHM1_HYPEX|nr:putative Chymotrypsinogen A [Hypsibius exemplaris]